MNLKLKKIEKHRLELEQPLVQPLCTNSRLHKLRVTLHISTISRSSSSVILRHARERASKAIRSNDLSFTELYFALLAASHSA